MNAPLLVELFTEELPPKALKTLGNAFANAIADGLKKKNLLVPDCTTTMYATPRRLAVRLSAVRAQAEDQPVEQKLMPLTVARGTDGKASPALRKKLAAIGHEALADSFPDGKDLAVKAEGKAEFLWLRTLAKGEALQPALEAALASSIEKLPIPKVMSYQLADGITTVKFVRPAHGLVALHGANSLPVSALGLTAGRVTHGHRFLGTSDIELRHADEYESRLKSEGKVIASFDARRLEIDTQLKARAVELGGSLGDYESLLDEVTALVEWPVVYEASFECEFLAVPQECLILTMRTNQRYFPLFDGAGKLTEKFLVVSNMQVADPSNIIDGNRRVVRPRLADARFFYDQDRKTRLEARVPLLGKVVYHNKLGTQLERVERIQLLAGQIARMIGADAALAERAAWLSKADLSTDMVGEFPELQGIMGRYYALHDGEPQAVADAISEHYLPRFAGDRLPESPDACCVALADKLDTIIGIFGIGAIPTGDKDPFALRRHALGVIRILIEKKLDVGLLALVDSAIAVMPQHAKTDWLPVLGFILDRARSYFSEKGYASTAIEAVLQPFGSVNWLHTLPEIVAEASQFIATEDGKILAEANKRITNILKKSGHEVPLGFAPDEFKVKPNPKLFKDQAEIELWNALQKIGAESLALKRQQRFAESLRVLSQLGVPTRSFFDDVMVNVDDTDTRDNRITLLQHARAYMNQVADLSLMAS